MSTRPGDLLRLCDRTGAEIEGLIGRAAWLRANPRPPHSLGGRRLAFLWDGEGFRNRAAFELGARLLGGIGVEIPGRLGEREAIGDLAQYLDNWFDAIVVRTSRFERLQELADAATAPVVNARTRHNHPCEILGDLAFIRSLRGRLDGLHIVFVGEATNLCHSWCEAAAVLPLAVTQVAPPGFEVDPSWWETLTPAPPGTLALTDDLADAITTADVVYTDCWPPRATDDERERVGALFEPLQVTAALLERAPTAALFLPCPPVTRGEEVSADAMTSPKCRVVEAKDWLLHAQSALLEEILAEDLAG
ncbi:MAG: ornithine carbamoyltransferase [Acidimicrobiales bacterium]